MASSWPNNYQEPVKDEQEKEDEDKDDLLELTLGLGFSGSRTKPGNGSSSVLASASSSSQLQSRQELGLGLGLGLDYQTLGDGSGNHYHGLRQNLHGHRMPTLPLLTSAPPTSSSSSSSSSSSWSLSWPSHMDASSGGFLHRERNLHMPVPEAAGHDCSRPPETGLWFSLRSVSNRDEGLLPQISKAYIRVKDENVTVFMVKKYLVRKLGLSSEDEIDISCMGQKLFDSQTLKYVRDGVWRSILINSMVACMEGTNDAAVSHMMSLHYGKSCFSD